MVKAASLFILLVVVASCSCVMIQCVYKTYRWERLGSYYGCLGRIHSEINPRSLDEISDEAVKSRDMIDGDWRKTLHEKVKFLSIGKSNLEMLPKKINEFFPNLEILQWFNGSLRAITADDLAPFPNIKHLYISGNKIDTLEVGVFSKNLQLVDIYADNNSIARAGAGLLKDLKGLKFADFRGNPCIDKLATSTSEIKELNQQLPLKCPLESIESSTEPLPPKEECCVRETINEEVDELKRLTTEQGETIAHLLKENEEFKNSMKGYNERIRGIDVALSELAPPGGEPMGREAVDRVESFDESRGESTDQEVADDSEPDQEEIESVVELTTAKSTPESIDEDR